VKRLRICVTDISTRQAGKNSFADDMARRSFSDNSTDIAAKVDAVAKSNLHNNWMLLAGIP
jgi:hypothetical protein